MNSLACWELKINNHAPDRMKMNTLQFTRCRTNYSVHWWKSTRLCHRKKSMKSNRLKWIVNPQKKSSCTSPSLKSVTPTPIGIPNGRPVIQVWKDFLSLSNMSNKNQYEIKSDTEIIIQIVYIFKYLFSQRDYFLQYIFKCAIIMHVMIINIPMYCLVKLEMKFLMLCQICMGQNVRYPEWTNTIYIYVNKTFH